MIETNGASWLAALMTFGDRPFGSQSCRKLLGVAPSGLGVVAGLL